MYLYAIPWNRPTLSVDLFYTYGEKINKDGIKGTFVGYSSKTQLIYIESEMSPDENPDIAKYFIKQVAG